MRACTSLIVTVPALLFLTVTGLGGAQAPAGLFTSEVADAARTPKPQLTVEAAPHVNRVSDGINMLFDQNARPVLGVLATDRPQSTATMRCRGYERRRGVPCCRRHVAPGEHGQLAAGAVSGSGSDGRLPMFRKTDLNLEHALNLFDQDVAVNRL